MSNCRSHSARKTKISHILHASFSIAILVFFIKSKNKQRIYFLDKSVVFYYNKDKKLPYKTTKKTTTAALFPHGKGGKRMSPLQPEETYQTLAVIGNGFDLAHGYQTDYHSFIQKMSDKNLDRFKAYCQKEQEIKTWYDFETNIRILSETLFQQSLALPDDKKWKKNRKQVQELKTIFQAIHQRLIQYLKKETNKPAEKLKSVQPYLNGNTAIINFNYTETETIYLEKYFRENSSQRKTFHVHGLLKENDIILGYDGLNAACFSQYEDIQWSKDLCREDLAFRRALQKKDGETYRRLLSGLQEYRRQENTGKGIDDETEYLIPNFSEIKNLLQDIRNKPAIPKLHYQQIKTVVVLGHGIEADLHFLKRILSACTNLQKIVLFRYKKEPEASIQRKRDFLLPYSQNIQTVFYF